MFATPVLLWAVLAAQAPDSALTATLTTLRSATTQFRQDLAQASPQLVIARAQQVRVACAGSRLAADSLAPLVSGDAVARADLAALQRALGVCQRDWDMRGARANADSLRAWGPHRLSELDRAVRRYQSARAPATTPSSE